MKRIIYARILIMIMLLQVLSPVASYALTGGPSQPEFQSFEPVTTTEMVNLPDGGFTYNIPLMDIGGYPLNLSYHSDITADMEASCVGLGWSINPGVINRNIRALPDDFSGETVKKEYHLKPNTTFGASVAVSYELYGLDFLSLGMSMGVFYNNYWGIGYEFGLSPGISSGDKGAGSLTAGLSTNLNSQSGASFSPSLRYSKSIEEKDKKSHFGLSASVSTTVNSREGLKAISMSTDFSRGVKDKRKKEGEKDYNYTSAGSSGSASFSFAGNTFTPEFTMPQNNISVSVNIKPFGLELFGSNGAPNISGYYSRQFLSSKAEAKPAYGMLYAQNGASQTNSLMDFNREKDAAYHDYSINLPIVNPGYDVLSVNGQGIGGSFQLKRGDVPVFFDARSMAVGNGGSLGLELGTGNTAHGGVDLKYNNTNSISKKWTSGNDALLNYNFRTSAAEGYEPAYYKAAGEMAIESDPQYYAAVGKDLAVRADLESAAGDRFKVTTRPFLKDEQGAFHGGSPTVRKSRERRNQVISYLTAQEASQVGLEKTILSYPLNDFTKAPDQISRTSQYRQPHHLSQIEANQQNGLRYIYGIPAYNITQKEVTFSVNAEQGMYCDKGTVAYIPGKDNSRNNERGQDRYFNSVETPAYAHTYLLTTVLGKDYEDLTGDGPSVDDFGSYTEINYTKVKTPAADSICHWRVPFGLQQANYNAGFYSKTHDDKGTYIYGQKEIWLVHSIVSKTMVAEFTYEDREDGYGVKNEDGGIAGYNLNKKLVKITLYAKPDRIKNGPTATPIKTVHFDYNYSLCPDTDNSKAAKQGKLTLTGLYFTFGFSEKGRLSDYHFFYKNNNPTHNYSSKDYDRWGNYKQNVTNPNCNNPVPGNPISNDEFPYAEQEASTANSDAGTWSLNQIDLPSGGIIKVDYQAKHYAYVQDKPAMQLMQITGINTIGNKKLYGIPYNPLADSLKVLFKIKDPAITKTRADLKRDYLRAIEIKDDYIYLKCYVKLNSGPIGNDKWEYVALYSRILDYDIDSSGDGYVVLEPLKTTDKDGIKNINPITKYSLQYMRENLPEIAYDQNPVDENSMILGLDLFQPLASMGKQLVQFVHGFNNVMIARGYCREIALDRSFIRLHEPHGMKYGGGSMVKKIEIDDRWGSMTGNPAEDFTYGQEYEYTTTEMQSDGTEREISSGVASYEPMIGGDENPWRVPRVISEKRILAIDNVHYVEEPFGEVFMPAPQVVFGEIVVRNLQYANVQRTATGWTKMQYYTAKDFPVKTRRTDLQKMPRRTFPLVSLLKIKTKAHMNASQGFLIETNNMAGQAKSSEVFDENGTRLSGVFYHYKTKGAGELDNTVDVIQPNGKVEKGLLGVNYSLAGDARESKSKTISGGVAFNLDGYLAAAIPVIIPLPWPNFEQSEEQFKSMSFTKLVNKFGVLERVEAYDLGSMIATENLAYDAETGEVLVTKTYNEFNDPIYNAKLPAHWAYQGMQGAYKNIGFETTAAGNITGGICNFPAPATAVRFFMPGDEVLLTGTVSKKAWVLHANTATSSNNFVFLIDIDGQPITLAPQSAKQPIRIKVIRSGLRNMPSTQIGSIASMHNPIDKGYLELNQPAKILHAETIEYSDQWQTFCGPNIDYCYGSDTINPFVRNVRGEWRPLKSWLYLTERDRTPLASTTNVSSTNIRDNGYYLAFTSFWQRPPNNQPLALWQKKETDWIWSATTTQINPNGTELESQNRLGLYSAEILGYYNQLITGVASNSRYRQMAFEGFEDFGYNAALDSSGCIFPRHFGEGFDGAPNTITDETFHTGNYALKLVGTSARTSYQIIENCPPGKGSAKATSRPPAGPYIIDPCECIQSFSPDAGKYVVTAWVKEGNGLGQRSFTKHNLQVITNSSSSNFTAQGMVIDGWQRIEGVFEVAPGDTQITVELSALPGTTAYFDDVRIFPFDGNMTNYVYDDVSLKLLAELDANGYAKFYEYSTEGELIRIKQETNAGIVTLQEARSSTPK